MKIIVDTSVWIDFFNGRENEQTAILKQLIRDDGPIHLIPVIIQEILQGIRKDDQFNTVLDLLRGFPVLDRRAVPDAIGAAQLYRSLRKKGITIRKSNDCLIAYICINSDSKILFKDRDFNLMIQNSQLESAPGINIYQ